MAAPEIGMAVVRVLPDTLGDLDEGMLRPMLRGITEVDGLWVYVDQAEFAAEYQPFVRLPEAGSRVAVPLYRVRSITWQAPGEPELRS